MSDASVTAANKTYLGRVYTPLSNGDWSDLADGAIAISADGTLNAIGPREAILLSFPNNTVFDCRPQLIVPGFVDCHQHLCHYDWVRLVPNLMKWLEQIYELEARFADTRYANDVAHRFFADLISNGTTTACVHGPYFAHATDAAFQVASDLGIRLLMGMNTADQNVPTILRTSVKRSIRETTHLFDRWNGANGGLLSYCFTVRPAYCASRTLLTTTARLAHSAGAAAQCHLSEDKEGQRAIVEAFPQCRSDTEVYKEVGLLGNRTIMAHGIYLTELDLGWLRNSRTTLAHCPRANLMAGGKQFQLKKVKRARIKVGLGTDLGGGKGLSMFKTMEDAMKVTPNLSVHETMRLATIEGAIALGLGDCIGTLELGKDADFLVVSPKLSGGLDSCSLSIDDLLSSLIFCGDNRDVKLVSVKGRIVLANPS